MTDICTKRKVYHVTAQAQVLYYQLWEHQLVLATPPHDEGALQPSATPCHTPSSAATAAAGDPSRTPGWMLPGSGWAELRPNVCRLFWLCVSVCWLPVDRWGIPETGHGDDGGVGLVSGPAGNHPDVPLCQWHGLQQGRTSCFFVGVYFHSLHFIDGEIIKGTQLMFPLLFQYIVKEVSDFV